MEIQTDRTGVPASIAKGLSMVGVGLGILSVIPILIILLWIILPTLFFTVLYHLSSTVSSFHGEYVILGGLLFGLHGLIIGGLDFIESVKKRKSDESDRFVAMIAIALGILGILFF